MPLKTDRAKTELVHVDIGGASLVGDLTTPEDAKGLVLFAHGSGSSRLSPRNQFVADALNDRRLATLLIDLLTTNEEEIDRHTGHLRFDIALLAHRLALVSDWLEGEGHVGHLPLGLFGASTGGGAALVAAAERPDRMRAVVSRGGRPDLAGPSLGRVTAPTLLIVGEWDEPVIAMNQDAMRQMHAPVRLEIVPRATHLFEEPGALERVATLAGTWFDQYLTE